MTRRAIHDERYWAGHLAKHPASGLSLREYCRREGIEVHQFYYWRKRTAASTIKRQPTVVGQKSAPINSVSKNEHEGKSVVIQINDRTSISIPAQMLYTIEAVLGMAQRFYEQDRTANPSSSFRSVIVQ
jgi:hypothetical protein